MFLVELIAIGGSLVAGLVVVLTAPSWYPLIARICRWESHQLAQKEELNEPTECGPALRKLRRRPRA